MGYRRISALGGGWWSRQGPVDQTGTQAVSHTFSSDQSRSLLARALAKRRRILQQPACELFCRSTQSVPRKRREPRLAGRFDSASAAEKVICHVEGSRDIVQQRD